ncbi:MAG: LPP20 family lipoprotein [Nitrospirae bacterium]|nr:LPP20 family lipoprotein [Nitrospirota bacterium]
MKYVKNLYFIAIAALLIFAGCSSGSKITKDTPIQNIVAPEWVMQGSGAFGGDKGKVFYGVGSASNITDFSLLRKLSDAESRNEIAKVVQVYTASLLEAYKASTSSGVSTSPSEEQHVETALKEVASMTLSGIEIVHHWQDPRNGTLFSLARLDLNSFKDNIDKVKELSETVKETVKKNAERTHEKLEKEIEKQKGGR